MSPKIIFVLVCIESLYHFLEGYKIKTILNVVFSESHIIELLNK